MDPVMIVLLVVDAVLLICVIVELARRAGKKKKDFISEDAVTDGAPAATDGAAEDAAADAAAAEAPAQAEEEKPSLYVFGVQEEETKAEEPAAEEPAKEELPVAETPAETAVQSESAQEEEKEEPPRETAPLPKADFGRGSEPAAPKKPFYERMLEADDETKEFYNELRNEFKSYRNVNARVSKGYDSFRKNRQLVARLLLSGKTIKLYLRLNAGEYEDAKYHQQYVGDKKTYAEIPMLVKVKSRRALANAKTLIADLMAKEGAEKKSRYVKVDYLKTLEALKEND